MLCCIAESTSTSTLYLVVCVVRTDFTDWFSDL